MKPNSLAFRLVAVAILWAVAVLVVGGLVLSAAFRDTVEAAFDARLGARLEGLVAAADVSSAGQPLLDRPPEDTRFEQPYSGLYWQITGVGATLRSRSLWDQLLAPPDGPLPVGEERLDIVSGPDGQRLRTLARSIALPGSSAPVLFTIASDLGEVEAEVARFNGMLYWSLGVLGLGLIAAVFFQVHVGLEPLRRMSRALAAIRSGRADRLEGRYPAEIAPLADELNALVDHNAEVVARARTHVGNLAHALKTPLSVLANEAAAGDGALSETVARQAAAMRRHVDHHLVRARTAATAGVLGARTPVAPVIDDLVRTLRHIHALRDLAMESTVEPDAQFRGERQDLEEMAGNLVDNACAWASSTVHITAEMAGPELRLRIEDDGPGLSESEARKVMERGARLDESMPGSGLGLAIVRDVAGLYGGRLELDRSTLGGLAAILTLPAAET